MNDFPPGLLRYLDAVNDSNLNEKCFNKEAIYDKNYDVLIFDGKDKIYINCTIKAFDIFNCFGFFNCKISWKSDRYFGDILNNGFAFESEFWKE